MHAHAYAFRAARPGQDAREEPEYVRDGSAIHFLP